MALTDTGIYRSIVEASKKDDKRKLFDLTNQFFKNYPDSRYYPDVKLIIAEKETSPGEAVEKYNYIINKFPDFEKNDYIQLQICEIFSLMSDWQKLRVNSITGIKKFKKSRYSVQFRFHFINSAINLQSFDDAEEECRFILNNYHDYNILSRALLSSAVINKYKYGFSRKYIKNLRELLLGFNNSEVYPTILYLTGDFYEKKENYNSAFSAYKEVVYRFPLSPEADSAEKKIKSLMKFAPKPAEIIPNEKTISDTDSLDISPDQQLALENDTSIIYSISIGPFSNIKSLEDIKKIVKTYGETRTLRLKNGYMIYIGKLDNSENALNLKIRLAEEYGINGRIVRIGTKGDKKFIYGE